MTIFEKAWSVVKADGAMTSGTSGTNNPRHGSDSPGEPKNLNRLQTRARKARKRGRFPSKTSMRPPGYGKGGVLDPNRGKNPPRRAKETESAPDIESLLAENREMMGSTAAKSTSNLLYSLGLIRKYGDTMNEDGKSWTIDVNTMWSLLDRDEGLADAVADTIADIQEGLSARQLINALFERNRNLAERTLDYISDLHAGSSGYWDDDGENMILLSWDAYYELHPEERAWGY